MYSVVENTVGSEKYICQWKKEVKNAQWQGVLKNGSDIQKWTCDKDSSEKGWYDYSVLSTRTAFNFNQLAKVHFITYSCVCTIYRFDIWGNLSVVMCFEIYEPWRVLLDIQPFQQHRMEN